MSAVVSMFFYVAGAVAGACLDPDQDGVVPPLPLLQRGDEFEGVGRDDTVIVVRFIGTVTSVPANMPC